MERFSHSKISAFKQCPKSYHFKYVQKEKEQFSTIERHMGSSVHDALHWAYDGGEKKDLTGLLEQYDRYWYDGGPEEFVIVKSGMRRESYYQDGRRMVEEFYDRVYEDDRSKTLGLEKKFELILNEEVRFTGIIDRLVRQPDGTIRLIDYKTGKRESDPRVDLQLAYYALYVFDSEGVEEVELAYENLRRGRIEMVRVRKSESRAWEDRICSDVREIGATRCFEASPSILCNWCGYNPICAEADCSISSARASRPAAATGSTCPECGSELQERRGRFGSFIGCRGFPGCRYTRDSW